MSQLEDLTVGDATPKVQKASIKDLTTAVNRISYAFKTPDAAVAPDMLQLAADGNMSLGGVPLVYATVGRSFLVQNADTTNSTARITAVSSSGNAVIAVQGGANSTDTGFTLRNEGGVDIAKFRLDLVQSALKLDMRNAGANNVVFRVNTTGEVTVGSDTVSTIARLQVMTGTAALAGSENAIFVRSLNPTTTPVMISGYNGGSLQIAGGNNGATGGRGGQIDFNSATWGSAPGTIVFRAGIAADGSISPEVGRWYANGFFGVGTGVEGAATIHARAPSGTRCRVLSESVGDSAGFTGRRVNGTYAAPTSVTTGDIIAFFNAHASTGGAGNYAVGATIQVLATQTWSPTASGSSLSFTTVANNTLTTTQALYLDHNGFAGFNTLTPQSRLVVALSNGGIGYEIDPNNVSTVRVLDRSTGVYQSVESRAQTHSWKAGTTGNTQAMMIEFNGNVGINTTNITGGANNTALDAKLFVANGPVSTVLVVGDSGNGTAGIYSGLKIKNGTRNAASGGLNYFDITTRPGDTGNGVATQADRTMIRLESSMSLNPRLVLQPTGTTSQVIIGDPTNAGANTRLVIQNEPAWNYPGISIAGKNMSNAGALPSADLVLQRDGAVTSTAGLMPWLQFESKDAAFAGNNAAAIAAAANSFQVWNYVSNAWVQKLIVDSGTLTSNNPALINGGITIRGPSAGTGNIVLQSNAAIGVAHWISSKTSGYLHLGGNGAAEPAVGNIVVAPTGKNIALYPLNETQLGYKYGHAGSFVGLHVCNTDTGPNSQAHLLLTSGYTAGSSSIGTISWGMPNISGSGTGRLANIGGGTDQNHTAANPQGYFVISTKNATDSTAVPRVTVRASGNVNFGNSANDTSRLWVFDEGRNVDGVTVDSSDYAGNNKSSFVTERGGTSGYSMMFNVAGSLAGTISHPSISSTSYGTSSDRRIKTNIAMAASAGAIIDSIRVVSHDFIADGYHVPYGFVAQELYESYPPAVVVGDNELDVGPTSKIWQVDNSKLVPLLVKEVQELRQDKVLTRTEMDAMKAELTELRELVNLLLENKSK